MDQQRFDYLTQQRNAGGLSYEAAQAYDAADSRHEFDQWKGGTAGADQGGTIAVPGVLGGGQPAPAPGQGQGDAVLPAGSVPPPPSDQPPPASDIPTQHNPYPQAQPHDFWNDIGLPPDPRYIGPHPVVARLLNTVDFTEAGRRHAAGLPPDAPLTSFGEGSGYPQMGRTLAGMAYNTPPAALAQMSDDPLMQTILKAGGHLTQGGLLAAMLLRRALRR